MYNFYNEELQKYSEQHSSPLPDILDEIERYTHIYTTAPRMLSGAYQGRFLHSMVQIKNPGTIVEIGTFTGYSAIAMASALQGNGHLHTIDIDEEKEEVVRSFFTKAGLQDKITLHIGDAGKIIGTIDGPYDMVFIDADKQSYSKYFDLVIDKMNKGGVILADNVLWSGKVLDSNPDESTKAIRHYNEKVNNDSRVESILLPVRDGIMMSVVL